MLLKLILKPTYAISNPIIQVGNSILYEVGEDLDEEDVEEYQLKLSKLLKDLKISEGDTLIIEDMI